MIGKTISHYKIIEKLGEGGMGVVYKALDTTLDRYVAIKFLPPHLSTDEEATKRFIHEAKAASSLDHANIGTIYEVEKTSDGQTFIVMAHYEGETLRERIDRGNISVDEALNIISQVASGLARAHETEIVHRDIKPSNIIITKHGEAKIIDFGLAKLAGKTRLTKEGTTLGTVAYMSPEQAKGEEVDHRSDIFSLGAIFYEMLAEVPPFKGEHEAALLYEIVHEEPRALSDYRNDIPQECQSVIDKALRKNLAHRHQSATDMKTGLDAMKRLSEEVSSQRESKQQRPEDSKRGRWIAGAIAAVFIVAVALVFIFWQNRRETVSAQEMSLAVIDFSDLAKTDDPTISAGITELVYIGLVEASPIRIQSPELVHDLRRRLFGSTEGPIQEGQALEIARKSGATYVLTGRIGTVGDEQFITWRLIDAKSGESIGAQKINPNKMSVLANEIVGAVLPLIARYAGIDQPIEQVPVEQITTEISPAYQHYIKGKMLYQQTQYEQALNELEQAVALDSSFALAYAGLARWYFGAIFDLSKANHYADLAWRFRSRLGIKDRMFLKALRYSINYQVNQEIATLREILELWPDDREAIRRLAQGTYFWGLMKECVAVHEEGEKLYPDDIVIGGATHLFSLVSLGRIDEAFRATKSYVEKHPDDPHSWHELAMRYLALGYPDSAAIAFRKVLEIDPTWMQRGEFAYCEYHAGNLERAITIFEQNLEGTDLGEDKRFYLMVPMYTRVSLATVYLESGRYEDVLSICDEMRQYAEENPVGSYFIGRLYVTINQAEKAFQMAREMSQSDRVGMQVHALNIRGKLLAATGDLEGARAAATKLHEWADERGHFLHQHAFEIEAEIALTENDHKVALEVLQSWRQMGVWRGGLLWLEYQTMLARAHQMAGQTEKAAAIHEELIRVIKGHALSHYELGKLYEEMNRPDDAKKEYEKFLEMWKNADEGLPQLEDARARLAKLKGV